MKYRCYACDWRGHDDEVLWKRDSLTTEFWGVVKTDRWEYAACPNCESDDIAEVEEKDEPEPAEPNELSAVLVDIARAGAGL